MGSKSWEVSGCPRALGPQESHGLCGQDTTPAQAAPICLSGCAQWALEPGPAGRGEGTVWLSVESEWVVGWGAGWLQRPVVPP